MNSNKLVIIGWILAALLQAGSFAYFIGGLSARVKTLEDGQHQLQDQVERMEQHLLWKDGGSK